MFLLRFALLALAFAVAPQTPDPDPFAGIPNLEISYYDVSGKTPAAVRKDMNGKRLTDPGDGKPVDALSRWRFNWRWRGNGAGKCNLNSLELTYSATVTLPRLVGEETASKSLRERWRRYYRALKEHEAGHVGYAYAHRDEILAAIKGATCETANEAGRAALARIAAHDRDYDARTRHGVTQGAVFP